MNKNNLWLIFLFFLILLIILSCRTAEFGHESININGMIYDFSNRPVPNCGISIGTKYKTHTDINGRFTIVKVPAGTYIAETQKPGFETWFEEITITEFGQIIYIRIPSQSQLLSLVDDALTSGDLDIAEEYAERAYRINSRNAEMLFYYAAVKFRQGEYEKAISTLEFAMESGAKDPCFGKFLNALKELQNE